MKVVIVGSILLNLFLASSVFAERHELHSMYGQEATGTILHLEESTLRVPKNWHHESPAIGMYGVNSKIARLNQPTNFIQKPVIVAVIDTGVDVNHKALQGKIWVNEDEIPGNGIDDDKNGYIDDIYGWNFLGSKEGNAVFSPSPPLGNPYQLVKQKLAEQYRFASYQFVRDYAVLQSKFEANQLSREETDQYQKLKKNIETDLAYANRNLKQYKLDEKVVKAAQEQLASELAITSFDKKSLSEIQTDDQRLLVAIETLLHFHDLGLNLADIQKRIKKLEININHTLNYKDDSRSKIIGDKPFDFSDSDYGNNDISGPDPLHGTHVAGIIAAKGDNNPTLEVALGIAEHVKIMPIRAVPEIGDEQDKDVANAIRYAVKNGAQIINLSFGKYSSPYRGEVLKALKYAEEEKVLIVSSAGNEYRNIELTPIFPNPKLAESEERESLSNWITVGASTINFDESFVALFSNYGPSSVDFIAPGSYIYSTVPGDKFAFMSGTSMAAPVVSAMAAVLLNHAPGSSPATIKSILIEGQMPLENINIFKPYLGFVELHSLFKYPGMLNLNKSIELIYSRQSRLGAL